MPCNALNWQCWQRWMGPPHQRATTSCCGGWETLHARQQQNARSACVCVRSCRVRAYSADGQWNISCVAHAEESEKKTVIFRHLLVSDVLFYRWDTGDQMDGGRGKDRESDGGRKQKAVTSKFDEIWGRRRAWITWQYDAPPTLTNKSLTSA